MGLLQELAGSIKTPSRVVKTMEGLAVLPGQLETTSSEVFIKPNYPDYAVQMCCLGTLFGWAITRKGHPVQTRIYRIVALAGGLYWSGFALTNIDKINPSQWELVLGSIGFSAGALCGSMAKSWSFDHPE